MSLEQTVLEGVEQAPHAMIGLMQGENIGKMLVQLNDTGAERKRN